jgi:hypothetical protein
VVAGERAHSVSVDRVKGGVLARRAGIIALCVLSLGVCVGLAAWQWNRFENGGTWQNLGYVLQWPLFGLFPAFMFWRLRKLRLQPAERPEPQQAPPREPDKAVSGQDGGGTAASAALEAPAAAGAPKAAGATNAARAADDDHDPELAAYNRYLAQLNALDQQETR